MADQRVVEVAREFVEAFNAADWPRFAATLAADVLYEEAGTGRRVQGAEEYVRLSQGWKEAFPDARGTVRTTLTGDGTVAQELVWEGTHSGPLAGPAGAIPPSGRRVSVAGTLWYAFEAGRVRSIRHHLDMMTMMQQIGAGPPQ